MVMGLPVERLGHRLTIALFVLLSASWLMRCGSQPEEYDYHGSSPDLNELNAWPDADSQVQPLDLQTRETLPEDRVDETGPEDGALPDLVAIDYGEDSQAELLQTRDCSVTLSTPSPDGTAVFLAGDFTNWQNAQLPLTDDGSGTWVLELALADVSAGSHPYKFHTAGDSWFLDASNPQTYTTSDGYENSKLSVPDCRLPLIRLKERQMTTTSVHVVAEVLAGIEDQSILPSTAEVVVNGASRKNVDFDPSTGLFDVSLSDLPEGSKVSLLFTIANSAGTSEPLLVSLWLDDGSWTWQDATIYFAFTDRFANGDPDNDASSNCPDSASLTDWLGGDFSGIRQKIESGYFTDLGVNVLWISPVVDNPSACFAGTVSGTLYTSYHGYFPSDNFATEEHFGSMDELVAMVNAAHDRGIRVIVDFVANHVSNDNPIWTQHSGDDWFHNYTPCKPAWDKPIECWFEEYLPDFNYTNDAPVEWMTDNALYWIRATGIDGFRVDAVKHMRHSFLRSLRWKIATQVEANSNLDFYMVGETFTGEWNDGTPTSQAIIKEYVTPDELSGQFDFPFYWKILRAVGRAEGTLSELAQFVGDAEAYWGSAPMSSFIGNHDVPRFTSHAAGQISDLWGNGSQEQGLTNPPSQPLDELPYLKTRLALGTMLTLPEIPTIYYGDEIGLAGAGDPDNRRMMVFDGLSEFQSAVLSFVQTAAAARKALPALRRGTFGLISATEDFLVFSRTAAGETVVVMVNRSSESRQATVTGVFGDGTALKNYMTLQSVGSVAGNSLQVDIAPWGLVILAP